jgi:spore maturation protein CgeB
VNIFGISMSERISFFKEIHADIIATQLLQEAGKWLYSDCKDSKIVSMPHALNPDVFKPLNCQRMIDIGVRVNRYTASLGDNDRNRIIDFFLHDESTKDYVMDISWNPAKRFKRDEWAFFLNKCKGTLATEAGSFYLQKDDQLVNEIQAYIERTHKARKDFYIIRKKSVFSRIFSILPHSGKKIVQSLFYRYAKRFKLQHEGLLFEDVSFEEIHDKFFRCQLHAPVYTKAISSRHFDAIGTKTCLIMFGGRYNDILKPDEHYIKLEDDFSNIDDVKEKFSDESFREDMVNRTYEYVMQNHTYSHRMKKIIGTIDI